uniref:Uncharacterized protein n=1 Tax=Acrobeloides nanus TaxID=290746 RepID=A0A914D275_9BILA
MSLFDTPKVKAKRISGSNNPAIITISDDENTNLTSTPGPSRKVNASYSNISKLNGHSFQRHESNLSTKSTIGENNDRSKFFIPLNAYTSEIHRESVMKILLSNTFLVAPDIFFRAKIAAIVAYNFYKNFPNCGIVFIGSKELELQMELCKTLGIPTNLLFDFTKESKRKKLIGEKLSGVFFVQAQAYIKNIQEHFRKVPLKLLVINEAEKAQGSNALSKLVTSTMNSLFGDDYQGFRILALASSIERNLPKAQSLIANLNISNLMIKNYDDTTFTKALYSKDSFVYDIDVGEQFKQHLSSWREGTKNFTEFLVSANFLNESEPDALIFHDFEKWSKKTSFDDPVFINLFEVVPALIEAYKILICHGYRAFFLFLTAQIPKTSELLEKIMENSFLKEVYQFSIENFGYDAFPDRETISFEEMSKMHPKMPRLIDLLNEILTPKCPKIMIFCGNFFASRAVAELLNNWNAGRVLENWSEYSEQLLESRLLGPAQQDEKWFGMWKVLP